MHEENGVDAFPLEKEIVSLIPYDPLIGENIEGARPDKLFVVFSSELSQFHVVILDQKKATRRWLICELIFCRIFS